MTVDASIWIAPPRSAALASSSARLLPTPSEVVLYTTQTLQMGFRLAPATSPNLHDAIDSRGAHDVYLAPSAHRLLSASAELSRLSTCHADGGVSIPYWVAARLGLALVGPDL